MLHRQSALVIKNVYLLRLFRVSSVRRTIVILFLIILKNMICNYILYILMFFFLYLTVFVSLFSNESNLKFFFHYLSFITFLFKRFEIVIKDHLTTFFPVLRLNVTFVLYIYIL